MDNKRMNHFHLAENAQAAINGNKTTNQLPDFNYDKIKGQQLRQGLVNQLIPFFEEDSVFALIDYAAALEEYVREGNGELTGSESW